jgi:hypothetical protein
MREEHCRRVLVPFATAPGSLAMFTAILRAFVINPASENCRP